MKLVYFTDKDYDGYTIGVYEQNDGTYLALTGTWSKSFKTLNGAIKALNKRLGINK